MTENSIVQNHDEKDYYISFFNGVWKWFGLQKIIKAGRASSMTYVNIAEIYLIYGFFKKALRYALKAIRTDKNNAKAYTITGLIKSHVKNDITAGKKYFLKAIKIGGNEEFVSLYQLIICEYLNENWQEAAKYERQFLDINSDNVTYIYLKAELNSYFYRFKEAFTGLFKIIVRCIREKKFPLAAFVSLLRSIFIFGTLRVLLPYQVFYIQALWMFNSGQEEEAQKLLFKAASKSNNKEDKENCYNTLLGFYYDNEEFKKCIDIANSILIKEKYIKAFKYKANSYERLGDYDKVIEVLEMMREYDINNEYVTYDFDIGMMYYIKNDYEKALSYFNKQIISNPTFDSLTYKGICLEESDCYDEAIKSYRRAVEYEPNDLCYYRMANLYYLQNDYESALENINRSLMLCKDSYNYNLKGDILISLKRIKEARACYQKAKVIE